MEIGKLYSLFYCIEPMVWNSNCGKIKKLKRDNVLFLIRNQRYIGTLYYVFLDRDMNELWLTCEEAKYYLKEIL